jgi:NADPH:quinone reductase-like Zn-dependent oxidoreductase
VRVHAASLNAADAKTAFGVFPPLPGQVYPYTLGRDFSGVVEASQSSQFTPGQAVCGFNPTRPALHGSFAEYTLLGSDGIVGRPDGLSFAEAACLGVAGTTALDGIDAIAIRPGETVLIIGAAGGVGSFAVQLAVAAGATVLAPGLASDADYLRDLGVARVLDRSGDLKEQLTGTRVAHLLDFANPLARFTELVDELVEPGSSAALVLGRIGSQKRPNGTTIRSVNASENPAQLARLAQHAQAGELRPPVTRTAPLGDIAEELIRFRDEHSQGKTVITVT